MAGSGFALKSAQWFVRGIQLSCAALILAIYSYFLAALNNHSLSVSTTVKTVEGIAGFACLYALVSLLLLCCLAGRTFSSFLAMLLDVAFIAAFIYVAVANKSGAGSCTGYLDTPFGKGNANETTSDGKDGFTVLPSYRVACKLQSACLGLAIIAILFFVLSMLGTVALARRHHKEKRFGPGPANDYTEGYGSSKPGFLAKLFGRKKLAATHPDNALPAHPLPDVDNRPSHGTERTAVDDDDDYDLGNQHQQGGDGIYKNDVGYGYPQPQGHGRQDGYGHIHYPEPEEHLPQTGYGHSQTAYRGYDDGVYDRV